ncbi:MAG: hypothetical protein PHR82_07445 [Endomicrobiaceae bacterium]|nr:hypothetical protein [Endomicrobiaceae bacterium]
MKKIKNFAYRIDSSDKTNHVVTLFQVCGGVCAFLYSQYSKSEYVIYSFIFFYLVVVVVLLIRTLVSWKYGTLKLYLNRKSGILFDKKAGFRNVSLRWRTIQLIINNLCQNISDQAKVNKILYDTGEMVGKNFYVKLENHLRKNQKSFDGESPEKKLEIWTDYDSSSGMGKFTIKDLILVSKIKFTITIENAFTCDEDKSSSRNCLCMFMSGYIAGFCSKLFNEPITVEEEECAMNRSDNICKFKVYQPSK